MQSQLLVGLVGIVVTTAVHISFMYLVIRLLGYLLNGREPSHNPLILISMVSAMVLCLVAIHLTGAIIWAELYLSIDEFSTLQEALYFSVVTATSLGYGDVTLSKHWQILSSLQALGSFLLFSVSAGGLFQLMLNTFPTPQLLSRKR